MSIVSRLVSILTGAGLMYFFDPQAGKRRRALLRDQFTGVQHSAAERAEAVAKHSADKARGAVIETVHHFASEDVSDEVLVARVRAEMGRHVSHPGAVEVTADAGVVTLSGNILVPEVQPFVAKARSIPGVRQVRNQLQVNDDAGNISDLQSGKTRTELR
jgi:osmotically-inducible protein OsmY